MRLKKVVIDHIILKSIIMRKKTMAKPKGTEIKKFRKQLGIKQISIPELSLKKNCPIKLRSYEKAEAGKEEIGTDIIENIARLFNALSKERNINPLINITSKDISIIKSKPLKGKNLKKNTTIHKVYIEKIFNFSQIQAILQNVEHKYIATEFNPSKSESDLIKALIKKIQNLFISQRNENKYNEDGFYNIESDLSELDKLTELGEALDRLREKNISLFAGNFEIKGLRVYDYNNELIFDENQNKDITKKYSIETHNEEYIILCFKKNSKSPALTFSYKNEFNELKLSEIISSYEQKFLDPKDSIYSDFLKITSERKKEKIRFSDPELIDENNESENIEEEILENIYNWFGYKNSINRSNVSIIDNSDDFENFFENNYERIEEKMNEIAWENHQDDLAEAYREDELIGKL